MDERERHEFGGGKSPSTMERGRLGFESEIDSTIVLPFFHYKPHTALVTSPTRTRRESTIRGETPLTLTRWIHDLNSLDDRLHAGFDLICLFIFYLPEVAADDGGNKNLDVIEDRPDLRSEGSIKAETQPVLTPSLLWRERWKSTDLRGETLDLRSLQRPGVAADGGGNKNLDVIEDRPDLRSESGQGVIPQFECEILCKIALFIEDAFRDGYGKIVNVRRLDDLDDVMNSIVGWNIWFQIVGTLYTHHQKCVIVDTQASGNNRKLSAFLGGLDLCDGRCDTAEHCLCDLDTTFHDDYHNPTFTYRDIVRTLKAGRPSALRYALQESEDRSAYSIRTSSPIDHHHASVFCSNKGPIYFPVS
ncbi:Phospholipase D delta-like protein [Drosera capensis]